MPQELLPKRCKCGRLKCRPAAEAPYPGNSGSSSGGQLNSANIRADMFDNVDGRESRLGSAPAYLSSTGSGDSSARSSRGSGADSAGAFASTYHSASSQFPMANVVPAAAGRAEGDLSLGAPSDDSAWTELPAEPCRTSCDVLVIGAGIAGLTAAHELRKRYPCVDLRILEAKDRVGGRTFSTPLRVSGGGTETFDLGGQWVGCTQTHIMETLDELGLDTYPQYIKGTKLMQLDGSQIRKYSSDIPNLGSWIGVVQLQLFIWRMDRLARRCSPYSPCHARAIRDLDGHTVDSYARAHIGNKAALQAIDAATKVVNGADSSRVSLLTLLNDIHSAGSLNLLLEATPGTAQEFKVKGGTQQISQLLAERVGKERIQLSAPVTSVVQRDGRVTVTTAGGQQFNCQYVISSMPPNQLVKVHFEPYLHPDKRNIIQNMPCGNLTKFIVTFEKAFWREAGFSGEVVTNGGPSPVSDCLTGPLSIVYDAVSFMGSAALVGFIAGSASIDWQKKTKQEREKAVISSLAEFFGKEANNYIEYQEKVWAEEPYTGGCPAGFAVPGVMRHLPALRQPHGRVFFCGTELATRWYGFMSGAVQTGREVAVEVLHELRPDCLSVADIQLINQRHSELLRARRSFSGESDEEGALDWLWRAATVSSLALLLVWAGKRCLEGVLDQTASALVGHSNAVD